MKNLFNVIVIVLALVIAYLIYYQVMGDPDNFLKDELTGKVDYHQPKPDSMLGTIYTGGPLVGLLLTFIIIAITFAIERAFSINKAKGKGNLNTFAKKVTKQLEEDKLDEAIETCNKQRGSMANVIRAAIERFKDVRDDSGFSTDKKISEVQRTIDETMNLETPLLEKNLVILSTIASISVLVGLLGTTLGMIRAFRALAQSGTVSAIQLSVGISEALYNTAGGLTGAIIAITAYNYFTTKSDNYVYQIDETIQNLTQIFSIRAQK